MTRLDPLWLRVYRDVGGDRYLSHAELPVEAAAATRTIWEIYDRLFGRFTGAGLDPLFHRFAHPPARRLAAPAFPRGVPMVIAGAGPSLDHSADELRRIRDRVLVASSWRGALALQSHGLHADLVLVEQQNVFDAQAAADDRRFGESAPCIRSPKCSRSPRRRPSLLKDLDADACRLAEGLPTWGLWPATLAALALEAHVPAIGLVLESPPPPLLALLELLAQAVPGACRDCVSGTPPKRGWTRTSLQSFAEIWAAQTSNVREITWRHERPNAFLLEEARHDLATMRPLLPDAHEALAVALQARAGNVPRDRSLTRAIELMLAWGADPHLRTGSATRPRTLVPSPFLAHRHPHRQRPAVVAAAGARAARADHAGRTADRARRSAHGGIVSALTFSSLLLPHNHLRRRRWLGHPTRSRRRSPMVNRDGPDASAC